MEQGLNESYVTLDRVLATCDDVRGRARDKSAPMRSYSRRTSYSRNSVPVVG